MYSGKIAVPPGGGGIRKISTSKIHEVMIYYKVAFETTNCLRPRIERLFA
jgi:hypothetical protein